MLANPAVQSLIQSGKEMFFVEMLACDQNHAQFKGLECGTFEDSRDYLQNFNVTVELKNKKFVNTGYKREYSTVGARWAGYEMVLPNGKYQGSPFWRGISWQFSVPVFEEEYREIQLDKYSRLL